MVGPRQKTSQCEAGIGYSSAQNRSPLPHFVCNCGDPTHLAGAERRVGVRERAWAGGREGWERRCWGTRERGGLLSVLFLEQNLDFTHGVVLST